jgi:hypothetical protein
MKMVTNKVINVKYYDIQDVAENIKDQITNFLKICDDEKLGCVGILPYHIYVVKYHKIMRTENYIDKWIPTIELISEMASKCKKEDIPVRDLLCRQCIEDVCDNYIQCL